MTENLKIEVSMVDVEGGVVDTSLATKQELATAVETKADLIQGKVPVIQLPGFNEISGVSEAIDEVETKLRDEIATAMANNNNGLESRIDEKLVLKADLVNGRVSASQSTAFKDVEGAKGALDGLKEALTTKYDQKVKELSEGKADLVNGKIPTSQLPVDDIVTPLEFQLKSQELDKKFSNLEDSVEAEKNAFITQVGNLIADKANAVDVYNKVDVDKKLSGKVDQNHLDAGLTAVAESNESYTTLALAQANNNLTILIKDSLRQSVEVASGGEQTVLYTAKGQPTYMNIIKRFDMSTINPSLSGTHPAFIVDGVEKSEIFIGTYQGKIVSGELLSLPNVDPTVNTNYDNFLNAARANGNGHHLITNAEWSAVALQCYKNNTQPMGNSYYGRSSEDPLLTGRRADGLNPGNTSGSARTLTGSGPVQWRHNGKNNGIADLSGNVNEWNSGMRLLNGEIQIIENNNAAKLTINLGAASVEWKAIDGTTGDLVAPDSTGTTVGTVKIATSGTNDYTLVIGSGSAFGSIKNPSTTKPVSTAALNKLKALGLFPLVDGSAAFNADAIYFNPTSNTIPARGGHWSYGVAAGVFYLNLDSARSNTHAFLGSRPAFVNL